MSAVRAEELAVHAGARRIAGPVTFTVSPGGSLGLRGPSGAGKSTLLRALVGLLPRVLRTTGAANVLGTDVVAAADLPALRARAGLVGQTPVLFADSILGNALFGVRHVLRASRTQLRVRAEAALVEAGPWEEVADRLDDPAAQLSIGQRQRLCLARALAFDPALLLLDEPTSALDDAAAAVVESTLLSLRGRRTLLLVSHDREQLTRLCDQVVVLDGTASGAARQHPDTNVHA